MKKSTYKLTKFQKELLVNKFGTYDTHNNGRLLNSQAYWWLKETFGDQCVIDQGDAMMPTTVSFTKRPYFTPVMMKHLKEVA